MKETKILYFKEYENFKKDDFFQNNIYDIEIKFLMLNNIIKEIKSEFLYFEYVGFLTIKDIIIVVLPKYNDSLKKGEHLIQKEYVRILGKVFEKYSKGKLNENFIMEQEHIEEEEFFNIFTLYKALIDDYVEYGEYEIEKKTNILSGEDEINWEKTIEELDSSLNWKKTPVYPVCYTYDEEDDQENYIRKIQKYLLVLASEYLEKLSHVGIESIELDFNFVDKIQGDLEYQLFRIDLELREVFSERKIKLLKIMKFILEKNGNETIKGIAIYGTKKFHIVWEDVCQKVLGHKKIDLCKPTWQDYETQNKTSVETLIPDILVEKEKEFFILDAKYYNIDFEKNGKLKNINKPGIGDIIKQYLYEDAIKIHHEYEKKEFEKYFNAFLFPTNGDELKLIGKIEFPIFKDRELNLVKIPTKKMYEMYLDGESGYNEFFHLLRIKNYVPLLS